MIIGQTREGNDVRRTGTISLALASLLLAVGSSPAALPTRASQLEDLGIAKSRYVAKSGAFSGAKLEAADKLIAHLLQRAGMMNKDQFTVAMMELAAIADNAHDYTFPGSAAARPATRLPMLLVWFPDGLFVVRATGSSASLVGDQVISIEGLSPDQLYSRAKLLAGGVEAVRKMQLSFAIGTQGVLHSLGLAQRPDHLRMTFKAKDGEIVRRDIAFVPTTSLPAIPQQQQVWFPQTGRPGEWTPALAANAAPLALREADRWFRSEPLPQLNARYVEFRTNFTTDGQDIGAFVKDTLATLEREKPANIIVDLRFDTGGDLQTNLRFMGALPRIAARRVYALIGPYTISAGITSALALRKAGGTKVTLVGAPVGDRARFWSEGGGAPLCLPNSKICMVPRTGMFDLAKGCAGERGCYGDQFGLNIGLPKPEISAPFLGRDYMAGRDPGMDAVAADIASRR
jgi:hypothetical protein